MPSWTHGGRFNVRSGDGDEDWLVWDNAANGNRGSGLSEQAANRLAADLELQYDVYGPRSPDQVRRVDPPKPVEKAWQPAGFLDAWIFEQGTWIGRVRGPGDTFTWIPQVELRQAEQF
ncbi:MULTISPECIES: hypothetical protein [unclassified Kribbella]|uniref:hypothetical protein n=1 Tax=unclassified Kribbella TaxID=2644121 RepID=UPI0030784BB8